ncbi:MAG: phosphate-starvation-inducible PsiE family protein [Eubacteriales bacterium]|nr:phosphate-starvation-inducible PsiE family protein [Eubacteriales bacterium]
MKQYLRNRISRSASYFEILLSILILLAVVIVAIEVVVNLYASVGLLIQGQYDFDIHTYLGVIFELIIAVEFVKMISKHTPESTIEVLLFVIARKIVIDEPRYNEILLGVAAIAALFIVKKYLIQKSNPDACILEGRTLLKEANAILGTHFAVEDGGLSVRDVIMNALSREEKQLFVGQEINLQNYQFRIYSLKNNEIDAIEALPMTLGRQIKRLLRRSR